ncbi:MAG TPA: hypothetical protein VJS91_05655 [Nitrososphaeraceae archaeon]|nr:hypothetical protein [Nitrososphaeraceae archaeon]
MPYWWLTTVNHICCPGTTYPLTHGANATNGVVITFSNDSTPVIREPLINHTLPQHNDNYPVIREPLITKPLPQSNSTTLPQQTVDSESVPVFYMFVQADGQQPTSSSRMTEEAAEESHQLATDDNSKVSRPPLYTQWNPDTGTTEVRRGYWSPIPEGKYITRTWTHAPPKSHTIRYEGIKHGYRGSVTRVHNPKTGYFEIRRSPLPNSTVSPVPGLHAQQATSSHLSPLREPLLNINDQLKLHSYIVALLLDSLPVKPVKLPIAPILNISTYSEPIAPILNHHF